MADRTFAETLAAAQAGDERAFTELFRATQPAVLRYLRVVAGARHEDLAGETWVQVVRGLKSFSGDEPAAFRAWVLSIARHRWLDEQRARARRPEEPMADIPDQPGRQDAADGAMAVITTESAVSLIARLPRDQAEVVFLRFVADLDVATTAELTGKPAGNVRVLAHRGLKKLRQLLETGERVRQV
jgi:RNA polymerase sigma-70 factor (ECF subfamily)